MALRIVFYSGNLFDCYLTIDATCHLKLVHKGIWLDSRILQARIHYIATTANFCLNSESIKEPKSLEYVAKIGSGEYGEGEILSIPASQLDVNANYLVIASACANYNGASGDFIMNVRGSGDANFISAAQSVNGWMATLTSAGIGKPSSSKGFAMALSMNGHKTQGTNPPRLVAVRLTY